MSLAQPVAVLADRLWDGTSLTLHRDMVATIVSGKISSLSPRSAIEVSGMEVWDLGDVTLMPGLINTHGHLGLDAGPNILETWQTDDDNRLLLRMLGTAQHALTSGTTTFRDMGGRNFLTGSVRDAVMDGLAEGPRLLVCGQQITTPKGQGHDWGAIEAGTEGELQDAVRSLAEGGVDFIKIMVGGGRITPSSDPRHTQFATDGIRAVVDCAHEHGLKVAAHAHSVESIRRAVLAGCDSIEHASWLSEDDGIGVDDEVLALIVDQGTYVAPTLSVSFPRARANADATHPLLGSLRDRLGVVKQMHDAGVRLIAGSDAGGWFTYAQDFPHEVILLHQAGLTPVEALRSATAVAAEAIGLASEIGTIEAGKHADLIGVAGNPLEDLMSLYQVTSVIHGGRRVR